MKSVSLFAKNLKKFRLKKKLSQEKLGELCNFHRTFISAIEREKRNVSFKTIDIIAEVLEISAKELFED